MKTAVICHSQTGFTRRYAQWIAEALEADSLSLTQAKGTDLRPYETILFGSWACAGRISKLDWFKRCALQYPDKRLLVFCTGASPAESPEIEPFLRQNFTDAERKRLPAFYCPGGLNYEKMSLPSRLMLRAFAKSVQAKRDKTPEEDAMAKVLGSSYDISDRKYIEPILAYLRA